MRFKIAIQKTDEGDCVSVPGLPGCWSQGATEHEAIRALERAGFRIARQGQHVVMTEGLRILTIPRQNPINALTMGGIVRDAGLSADEFKRLL